MNSEQVENVTRRLERRRGSLVDSGAGEERYYDSCEFKYVISLGMNARCGVLWEYIRSEGNLICRCFYRKAIFF